MYILCTLYLIGNIQNNLSDVIFVSLRAIIFTVNGTSNVRARQLHTLPLSPPSLPLSPPSLTLIHTLSLPLSLSLTHTLIHTHSPPLSLSLTHNTTHTLPLSPPSPPPPPPPSLSLSLSLSLSHTHAHTHTHTQTPHTLSPSLSHTHSPPSVPSSVSPPLRYWTDTVSALCGTLRPRLRSLANSTAPPTTSASPARSV